MALAKTKLAQTCTRGNLRSVCAQLFGVGRCCPSPWGAKERWEGPHRGPAAPLVGDCTTCQELRSSSAHSCVTQCFSMALRGQSQLRGPKSSSTGWLVQGTLFSDVPYSSFQEAAASWDAAQAVAGLALSKAGMHSMDHPGHSPSPAQGRGPQEGIPQVPHRGQVLRGYACGIGRSPTGALGFKAQPLQPLSLKLRWQIGRNVAVKHLIQSLAHPNPKVRGSISCSVGFPETPRG